MSARVGRYVAVATLAAAVDPGGLPTCVPPDTHLRLNPAHPIHALGSPPRRNDGPAPAIPTEATSTCHADVCAAGIDRARSTARVS